MARTQRTFVGPKPLAWLPNRVGFKFKGVTREGRPVECEVRREPATGMHHIWPVTAAGLKGWYDL